MSGSRGFAIIVLMLVLILTEWAFRFGVPSEPVDSFIRLLILLYGLWSVPMILLFGVSSESLKSRTRELLDRFPKLISAHTSVLIMLLTLTAVEFGCRLYFKLSYKAPYSEATYWEPCAVVRDPILGSRLPRDSVFSHAYVVNDSLIYKQYYHTDSFCRRKTPAIWPDSTYAQFVAVTGCSFAFGYGLKETETLSFFLDSALGYRGYNYGISGHGTQQTLALLQSRDLRAEMEEPTGLMVHLFIDEHIKRLIGSRRLIKLWASNYPYYYLKGDKPVRDGSFWTGRHFVSRFYRIISQSAFIDLFDIDIPWYTSDSHLRLFAAVLKEAKKEFLIQFPKGRFVVVIGPNSTLAASVKSALNDADVEVIDLSELLDKNKRHYRIHWTEAHPNANYYRDVAVAVSDYLKNDAGKGGSLP